MKHSLKRQVQPNTWSCLPTATAIVLGVNVQEVIEGIGHDGSDIVWPDLIDPLCRRAFSVQEIIDYVYPKGIAVTCRDARPGTYTKGSDKIFNIYEDYESRWKEIIFGKVGVMVGYNRDDQCHAVAWDGEGIIDPSTVKGQFTAKSLLVFDNIEN